MTENDYANLLGKDKSKVVSNEGKMLIICLDRSGSMHGSPMTGIKQGAKELG